MLFLSNPSFLFIALLFYSPPVFFSIYQTNLPLVLVYTVVHILQIRIHIPWESLTPLRHICIYLNKASFYFNRSTWKLTRNRRLNLKFEIHVPNCLKEGRNGTENEEMFQREEWGKACDNLYWKIIINQLINRQVRVWMPPLWGGGIGVEFIKDILVPGDNVPPTWSVDKNKNERKVKSLISLKSQEWNLPSKFQCRS